MKKSIAYNKAFKFSVKIVKFSKILKQEKKEFELGSQILRSGTSIGANLAEANGAISTADFSNKVSIAYKESLETRYWLDLLNEVDLIENSEYQQLSEDVDEISRILFSILKTTRLKDKSTSSN
jgi:four helix bundle protein